MFHTLQHWFEYNYWQPGHPFYEKAVWGNVFVIFVLAPLGYLWSKTKFWPLKPLKHVEEKLTKHIIEVREHHKRVHEHNKWMAQAMHELHIETTGTPPSETHPHFELKEKNGRPN